MNKEIEQEARILYDIVHEESFAPNYESINESSKLGWRRLAEMVLIDKKKPDEGTYLLRGETGNVVSRVFNYSFPKELDDATFITAWSNWIDDRKERKKAVTARAAKIQLKKLEAMGIKRAIAAIENSIEKGYQGIFEPSNNGANKSDEENPNRVDF